MDRTKLSYRIGWSLALLLTLGVLLLCQPVPARAETITVTNTLDSGAGSLRAAIAAASAGDTIVFDPALSGQTIVLASQLTIDKALTIDGAALAEPIKISGNDSVRVFYITANATLSHLDIINGRTTSGGGGIHNEAVILTLHGCTVRNNTAENSNGGGLYNNGGTVTIRQSVIRDNQTTGSTVGGGIGNWGTMTVLSSTISGNTAVAGGGVRNHGTLTITASTLSGNTAAYAGGIANLGTLTLANCTFSGNAATHGTYTGSALYQWGDNSYSTEIHHCTIANNTAAGTHQAAIELENGVITLKNSIIADNGSGNFYVWGNAGTDLVSQGYNLADTWNGLPLTTGDLTADPLLDALADNGGGTLTHALLPGSPALDAANPTVSLTTDQRGVARPQDGDNDGNARSDIGAYELAAARITLSKSAAPAIDAPYHGIVTFTVRLDNVTDAADTVILTDTLPGQTEFARWVENPGAGVTGNQITWSGVLTAHTALTFTFQVTQTGAYGATITNTAQASSTTSLVNAAASFTVIEPKTALLKTASPATAPYHGVLTYTLLLSNSGALNDPTVLLTDTLPAEVTFARWVENPGAVVNGDQLTWSGPLTAHTALTFTFQVTHTGAYPQPILNTAVYSGSTRAGQATATVFIGCAPTYTVQLTANDGVGSLRQALANVCAGGVVDFAPALAGQTITLTSPLNVLQDVTLDGSGLTTPVRISGGDATRLFVVSSGVHATLTGVDLARGYATGDGAAISNAGHLTLSHAQVTDHRGTSAIYNTSFLTLTHVTLARSGNSGRDGGGLHNLSTAVVLSSTLADNIAQSGGAIYSAGVLILRDSVISGNSSAYGGGVYINGSATISRCDFHHNAASIGGGGLTLNNGSATVSESTIRHNSAAGSAAGGGGLSNLGTLTVVSSTVSGNTASAYAGGGAFNEYPGELIVQGSVFSGNTARFGGAIGNKSTLRLFNSTLSGNASTDLTWGSSALDLWYINNTEINHCTIVFNTAQASPIPSGILLETGSLILRNSIVAYNNTDFNFRWYGGMFTSQGYNLANAWNGLPTTTGDLTGDPLLDVLADNGGGTLTHALLPGSPALDAANPVLSLTTDQRGLPRPQGAAADIGAFERGLLHLAKTVTPTTDAPYHGLVTYTLTLSNGGALDVPGVWLRDALPPAVTFARWVENHGAGVANDEITWNGTLTATTTLTLTFVAAHTGSYGETVVNTAALGDAHQRVQAAASFTVERPQLALSKTVTPTLAPRHGVVTYTLVLSNSGIAADPAVVLTDTLPAEVDFARWVEDHGAVVNGDQITWTGSLAAHTALTFTFQVTHTGDYGETVLNTAQWRGSIQTGQAAAGFSIECSAALTVTNIADAGPGSLRQAISGICPYGVVHFAPALAGQTITLSNVILIDKPVTLDGGGLSARVTLDGDDTTRLFIIADTAAVTITRLALTHGYAVYDSHYLDYGGAIYNAGVLTLRDMRFTDNRARQGGAVYSYYGSRLWVYDSEFYHNTAWADGGALYVYYDNTIAAVTGSTLMTNTAANGGAISNQGAVLTVTASLISGNSGSDNGGGLYLYEGSVTLADCIIAHNQANGGGGFYSLYGAVAITNTQILSNAARAYGGAGYSARASLTIAHSVIAGNISTDVAGGFLFREGAVTISDSALRDNRIYPPGSGRMGGAIYNLLGNNLTVTRSTFTGNQAQTNGGGIYNATAPLTVQASDFISNTAAEGGALYSYNATLNVSDSAFYSNTASTNGGGLRLVGGNTAIVTSILAHNTAASGAGLYNEGGGVSLANSTVSSNTATLSGGGLVNNLGDLTLRHVTLAANRAPSGGGLINMGDALYAYNSLLAHNSGGDCDNTSIPGVIAANIHNLIADGSCNENAVGLITGDPRLAPLDADGIHALLTDSPAIDAGDPAYCLPTDQRGVARPQGAVCDIGAFEATSRIRMKKTVTPFVVAPGQAITFTLTLSNDGGIPASGIVLTDTLPPFLGNVSLSSTLIVTHTGYIPPYVWMVQDLTPGQSGVITMSGVLTRPLAAGIYTNTAIIAAAGDLPVENNTAVVTWTVLNVAPAFTSAPVTIATQDVPYAYTTTAGDDNGDVLTFTALTLPAWLTLTDHGDGTAALFGTPGRADVGNHTVVLRVTDSEGLFDTQSFTITVATKSPYTIFLPLVARNSLAGAAR